MRIMNVEMRAREIMGRRLESEDVATAAKIADPTIVA